MNNYLKLIQRKYVPWVSEHYVLGVSIGVFMAIAYLVPFAGVLIPVLVAIFLHIVRIKTGSLRNALVCGFLFATVYEFFVLSWSWNASFYLASPGIGVPFVAALALIFFTLGLISLVAGLTFLPWIYVAVKIRVAPVLDVLLLASVWVMSEWLRVALLSVLSYGDGVLNPPYLSFGMVGYSLADYGSMLPLAHEGGIYLLSFSLILAGGILFYGYKVFKGEGSRKGIVGMSIVVLLTIVFCAFAHAGPMSSEESVPVTLITKYSYPVAPSYKEEIATAQENEELLVFPEGSRQFYPFNLIAPSTIHAGSGIIDSYPIRATPDSKVVPSSYFVTSATTTLVRQKHALAPYGEFTPLAMTILAHLTGFTKTLNTFTWGRHYLQGSYEGTFEFQAARGSVIFCDEVAVPGITKDIVAKTHANIIIAVASTHWFPEGYMLQRETIRMAKVRAVEAGVPLARSAYGSPAFAVDARGNLLYQGPWMHSSMETVQVPLP